ncbi:MAG: hypothetical protein GYA35_04405 [Thermoanaerobaculaceae bacterium]|nr:hypothetical protein [Thermoanaerobaculaceae bacterium]
MQGRRGGGNGDDLVVVEYSIPRSLTQQIASLPKSIFQRVNKTLFSNSYCF